MAALNDYIQQITDPALRQRLAEEADRLAQHTTFGLVFEEHVPEYTLLHGLSIRRGSTVIRRTDGSNEIFTVKQITGESALCENEDASETATFPLSELIPISRFGDPIFPMLEPIARVQNAPGDGPWHSIIEADNYHALQLLDYLYEGQVDCIYIDPPYNTGARDWKYNNNYVDSADQWRHSKWLSMMKRRLLLAKRILAPDGVLITTIDDNEYAHLWILLHDIFPQLSHNCVTIQHNPGGTQGKSFSVTNEYAIFSYSAKSTIYRKQHTGKDVYNLRRWGSTSGRYEAATCFYPIYVDGNLNVIGFGGVLANDLHPAAQTECNSDGTFSVWPIDVNGTEKKWRYARDTVESVQDRMFVERRNSRLEIILRRESEPPKTVWTNPLFNAEAYGTDMVKSIIGGAFSFPKSLYAVHEALSFAAAGKKDALIVDFFAGSGTTLHAVNLLNSEDGGRRRCILVTNNEVSDTDAKELRAQGFQPGNPEWEARGICRSVTWPRTQCSILGKQAGGEPLPGDYFTSRLLSRERNRSFYQLSFVETPANLTLTAKKQIISLIGKDKLAQSLAKADSRFIVSKKHTASVLFDPDAAEEWLAALDGQEHITDFYIVTKEIRRFSSIKKRIAALLGTVTTAESVKKPMSHGFAANAEYFKLGFLDKDSVALGQRFAELLPLLWLKAGASGPRPELNGETLPEMLILPQNGFAVLLDEDYYGEFSEKLLAAGGISTVFFVTDSEEAFREMSDGIAIKETYQLYRDYIDNFETGSRRNRL